MILATAYSDWKTNNKDNRDKLFSVVADNVTKQQPRTAVGRFGLDSWKKNMKEGSAALEHVQQRLCSLHPRKFSRVG